MNANRVARFVRLAPSWRQVFCTLLLFLFPVSVNGGQFESTEMLEIYELIKKRDYEGALAAATKTLRGENLTDARIVETLKLRGATHLRLANYDGAVADFSSALQLVDDDIWLLWQRCWAHTKGARFVPARRDCDRALHLASAQYDFFEETVRSEDELLPFRVDLRSAVTAKAELLKRVGEPRRAIELIHNNLQRKRFEPDVSILSQLSALNLQLGNLEEADQYISSAILEGQTLSNKSKASLIEQRAEIALRSGELHDAAEDFEQAYGLDQERPSLLYRVCATYLVAEKYQEALPKCAEFYTDNKTQPSAIDAYGLALLRRGEATLAKEVLENGVKHHPENPYLRIHLSEAFRALGRSEKAEMVLEPVPQILRDLYGKKAE